MSKDPFYDHYERQPAVYNPGKTFVPKPTGYPHYWGNKTHRIFLDSADIDVSYQTGFIPYTTAQVENGHSRTQITGPVLDEFTFQVTLPEPVVKGRLHLSRMHLFTGPNGANSVMKIMIPNFPHRYSYSSSQTGASIVLGTTSAVGLNSNTVVTTPSIDILDGIPVERLPQTFPLTIRLEHIVGAGTGALGNIPTAAANKTEIRRMIAFLTIVEDKESY